MSNQSNHTISGLLKTRNARFKGKSGDVELARERQQLTRMIEDNYPAFEPVRDLLLKRNPNWEKVEEDLCLHGSTLREEIRRHGMCSKHPDGGYHVDSHAKRYLGGGWLEELAWLAAMEAGADEAVFAQTIGWHAQGYHGQNEIDLIVRKGSRLGFTSCKAVGSEFNSDSRKHRNRLMDALHEADNLADHFGVDGDRVAILVTADLIDELKNQPRYMSLMGKAAVLDVRIIPLEELGWDKLVLAIGELLE